MEPTPLIRKACPICEEVGTRFVCKMGGEYLVTGLNGLKEDATLLKLAGLDFEKNGDMACSYHECLGCGTFYLREVFPMEEAFALNNTRPEVRHDLETEQSTNATVTSRIGKLHTVASLLTLAAQSSDRDYLNVLDYGFGGGRELEGMRALGAREVVGYNHYRGFFEMVQRRIASDIRLVSDRSELEELAPFDAVLCNAVLEHVPDPNEIVDHIRSILRPGGVAYFFAPNESRRRMSEYASLVHNNVGVKRLHLGHLQIWNSSSLPLSTYVANRGFEIIPVDPGVRMRDLSAVRGLGLQAAVHVSRIKDLVVSGIGLRTRRYRSSAFFARKAG